jgi:hypothetical protein
LNPPAVHGVLSQRALDNILGDIPRMHGSCTPHLARGSLE